MTSQATLALAVLCLSLWSALALLVDRRGPARVNRRFALLILLFCIPQSYFYTQLLMPPLGAAWLGLAAQAAIWLKGPLLLSMVRATVDDPAPREWRHYLAFPPALLGMALTPQWSMEWGMAGFAALLAYLLVALLHLWRSRSRLALVYAEYANSAWYWLLFVVAGLLVLVSVDLGIMAVAYARGLFPVEFIKVTNWMVASYFVVIAFFSVYRPQVFFREPRGTSVQEPPKEPDTAEPATPARTWRELDESLATQLARQLDSLMSREQLYRQHELSLAELAARLGISVHQASELLNLHQRQSFYEYLGAHRLRHACELLSDPACELRVLDIAFESGFGNKNSFYRAFREAHGMTPLEYRDQYARSGGPKPAATLAAHSQNPS